MPYIFTDDGEVVSALPDSEYYLKHYGTDPASGRYPEGSGDKPYQRSASFESLLYRIRSECGGMTDSQAAKYLGLGTREYKAKKSLAIEEEKMHQASMIKRMRDVEQMSFKAIANELNMKGESTARTIYERNKEGVKLSVQPVADAFKKRMKETNKFIDIGEGVERELGVPIERVDKAVELLKTEGYSVYVRNVAQATNPGKQTKVKILCPPGTKYEDVYKKEDNITSFVEYASSDNGDSFHSFKYPKSLDSKRLIVRSKEEGGAEKDGIIEIRPGVPDLSLGGSAYSQVRILVDDKRYLKGMAVYSDDLPPGIDVRFNSNKSKDKPKLEHLKSVEDNLKLDPNNPFGSFISAKGQSEYIDPKTGKKELSLINKRADEGDWGEWSKTLPSQFLGKQPISLINSQLKLGLDNKKAEYEEILKLENPVIKKRMMLDFADACDHTAVHLDAAALPRQRYQVILAIPSLKDDEIYAPNYRNGETVAAIRFPHAGQFEIAQLTVNNNNHEAKKTIGNGKDAVGINARVAEKLSGADFDGDTVMVIPCNKTATGGISKVQIQHRDQLSGLVGFDPKSQYAAHEGTKLMKKGNVGLEMGKISNLITDMQLAGASEEDLTKAVRHSMVVIDAYKHKLDYKQSEVDNDIRRLKNTYQLRIDPETGRKSTAAATILSAAKGQATVRRTKGSGRIDPETGKMIYNIDDETWTTVSKRGKVTEHHRTQRSTNMAETDDAFTLVRDKNNLKEVAYANYANSLKAMANQARKDSLSVKGHIYNSEAASLYEKEVKSLMAKIDASAKNAPRERLAQIIASSKVKTLENETYLTKEERGKKAQSFLAAARVSVGSKRPKFEITDREWEAIQAGAVNSSTLDKIINYAGTDKIASLATPRTTGRKVTDAQISRMRALYDSGNYTVADISDDLGVSTSTIWKYL